MWMGHGFQSGAGKCIHPSPGERAGGAWTAEQKAVDIFLITFTYAAVQTD